MLVQYYGHCCFALQTSDGRRAVFDPYEERIGYRAPLRPAQVTLVSRDHFAHAHLPSVLGRTVPIRGAADREVEGFRVRGVVGGHGPESEPVICFCVEVDGLRVCHLSMVESLDGEQLRQLGSVDLLLFPCGGGGALDAARAADVVRQLQPRWAIPMGYRTPFLDRSLFPALSPVEDLGRLLKMERRRESTVELRADHPSGTLVLWVPHAC
ncbi:MAG: MBL fold metallo-hydrolase [Armatimonadetes bacterium]|nr:MBL fold metallo-hydrolase [Armatimonadota bacterium]